MNTDPLLEKHRLDAARARRMVYDALLTHHAVRSPNNTTLGTLRRRAYQGMRDLTGSEAREVAARVLQAVTDPADDADLPGIVQEVLDERRPDLVALQPDGTTINWFGDPDDGVPGDPGLVTVDPDGTVANQPVPNHLKTSRAHDDNPDGRNDP